MDKWFKDILRFKNILPDKDPYHNRGRDQMRKKGGPEFECLWQDSHYQYQYGCSTNKSDGLSLSFLISPVRNVSRLILYMHEVES